eukprot:14693764-Alexandrium_andersonii.AAC.1
MERSQYPWSCASFTWMKSRPTSSLKSPVCWMAAGLRVAGRRCRRHVSHTRSLAAPTIAGVAPFSC